MRVTAPECHLDSETGVSTSFTGASLVANLGGEIVTCPTTALTGGNYRFGVGLSIRFRG